MRGLDDEELSLLTDSERKRIFGFPRRAREFRCGRALLRLMLQELTGKTACSHDIRVQDGGKPICVGGPAISVSHAGDIVVCVVAERGLVGIDVENTEQRQDIGQITDRFFSDNEKSWLASQSPDGFYMLWVIKEAFVKAHGQSIFGGLEKLRCTVDPPRINAIATEGSFRSLKLYRKADTFIALATTEIELEDVPTLYWKPRSREFAISDEFRFIAAS